MSTTKSTCSVCEAANIQKFIVHQQPQSTRATNLWPKYGFFCPLPFIGLCENVNSSSVTRYVEFIITCTVEPLLTNSCMINFLLGTNLFEMKINLKQSGSNVPSTHSPCMSKFLQYKVLFMKRGWFLVVSAALL